MLRTINAGSLPGVKEVQVRAALATHAVLLSPRLSTGRGQRGCRRGALSALPVGRRRLHAGALHKRSIPLSQHTCEECQQQLSYTGLL